MAADPRAKVYRAAWTVFIHLGCPVADAREPIEARAFAEGSSAHSMAQRVLRAEPRLGPGGADRGGAGQEDCGRGPAGDGSPQRRREFS